MTLVPRPQVGGTAGAQSDSLGWHLLGSWICLLWPSGRTDTQPESCPMGFVCRATIDEVETDVVEVEAKLDKVRCGAVPLHGVPCHPPS